MNDLLVILCDKESDGIVAANKAQLLTSVDRLYLFVQDKIDANELDWLDDSSFGINIQSARLWSGNIMELGIRAGIAYSDSDNILVCESKKMPSKDEIRKAQQSCTANGEYDDSKIKGINRNKFVISFNTVLSKPDKTFEIGAATRQSDSQFSTILQAIDTLYGLQDINLPKAPESLQEIHETILQLWKSKIKPQSKNRVIYAEQTTPKDFNNELKSIGVGGIAIFVLPQNQEKLYVHCKTLERFTSKNLLIWILKGVNNE